MHPPPSRLALLLAALAAPPLLAGDGAPPPRRASSQPPSAPTAAPVVRAVPDDVEARDTVLFWAASSDGRAGSRVVSDLYLLGPDGTDPGLTRVRGVVRFDPALVTAQTVEAGSDAVRLEAERGGDAVRFVAESASPGGELPAGVLLSVTFEIVGSPGTLTPLLVEVVEARGPGGGPAPHPIRVADGEIRVH